jgi:hypothetical protein
LFRVSRPLHPLPLFCTQHSLSFPSCLTVHYVAYQDRSM